MKRVEDLRGELEAPDQNPALDHLAREHLRSLVEEEDDREDLKPLTRQ